MDPYVYLAYIVFLKGKTNGDIRTINDAFSAYKDRLASPISSVIYEKQVQARMNFILQEQIDWNNATPAGFMKFLEKYRCKK